MTPGKLSLWVRNLGIKGCLLPQAYSEIPRISA
jgi:hypothetical protein